MNSNRKSKPFCGNFPQNMLKLRITKAFSHYQSFIVHCFFLTVNHPLPPHPPTFRLNFCIVKADNRSLYMGADKTSMPCPLSLCPAIPPWRIPDSHGKPPKIKNRNVCSCLPVWESDSALWKTGSIRGRKRAGGEVFSERTSDHT
jgi:hypothetical protein